MKAFDLIPLAVCTRKLLIPSTLSLREGPPANGVCVLNPCFEKFPVERGGFNLTVPPPEMSPSRDIVSARGPPPGALWKKEFCCVLHIV